MAGTVLWEVHLIIHCLFVLATNQADKFISCGNHTSAHNLNEKFPLLGATCAHFLPQHLIKVEQDARTTISAYASPQLLAPYHVN